MTTSQVTSSETPTKSSETSTQSNKPIRLSPGRVTDLRIKKLQELRELQQLLKQNVLTDAEFEQKMLVNKNKNTFEHNHVYLVGTNNK